MLMLVSGCGFQITFYDFDGDPIGKPKAQPRMFDEVLVSDDVPDEDSFVEEPYNSDNTIDYVYVPPRMKICMGPVRTIFIDKGIKRCANYRRLIDPCVRYVYLY